VAHEVCKDRGHLYVPQTTTRAIDPSVRVWNQEAVVKVFCQRCGEMKNLFQPDEGDTAPDDTEPVDYHAGDADEPVDPTVVT